MRVLPKHLARVVGGVTWIAAVGAVLSIVVYVGQREASEIGSQLRILKYGEPHERGAAIFELGMAVTREPDRVVPALIGALADEDGYVRSNAAKCLGTLKLGHPWSQTASDRLVPLLEDLDGRVISAAARSLAILDGDPKTVVPAMIQAAGIGRPAEVENSEARPKSDALPDPTSAAWKKDSRRDVFGALAAYAKRGDLLACSAVLGQAHHPDPQFRVIVSDAIDKGIGCDGTFGVLLEMSKDADRTVLEKVIRSLGKIAAEERDESRFAFEALLRLAHAPDLATRTRAIGVVGSLIESEQAVSRPAFEALLRLAKAPDLETRRQAITALGNAGRYYPKVFPVLELAFQTEELKYAAADAIGTIASRHLPADFVPIQEIRSDRAALRYVAAICLDRSKESEFAALLVANRDQNKQVCWQARHSLLGASRSGVIKTGSSGATPLNVAPALKAFTAPTADVDTRKLLLEMLAWEMRTGNAAALEGMYRAITDKDAGIRKMVVETIRPDSFIGPKIQFELVDKALYLAFRDDEPAVRASSESALERYVIEKFVPARFDPLKSIRGDEPGERFVAVSMLDPKKSRDLAALIDAVRDPDPRIRRRTVMSLQRVDAARPETAAALEAVTAACEDRDAGVREAAVKARVSLTTAITRRAVK